MQYRKIVLYSISIIVLLAVSYFAGQQSGNSYAQNKSNNVTTKQSFNSRNCERTFTIGDDLRVFAEINRVKEPPTDNSIFKESDNLSIYDENRKLLYKMKDFNISDDIEVIRLLEPNSREIMVTTNGGGTDNFLHVLKYKNGRIVEVIDPSETQFRGDHFTMLQYRTGMDAPYFKPSQLIVVQQIAGIDINPSASVFRGKGGKLQKVGEIHMQELGDFIEKQIATNK